MEPVTVLGARERQLSPHAVEVVLNTRSQGSGLGTHDNWAATGVMVPCLIEQMDAKDAMILFQQATRACYEINAPYFPTLSAVSNRLRIVLPSRYAGKVLRIMGPPADYQLRGWDFQLLAQEYSEDQQVPITLMGAVAPKGKKNAGGTGGAVRRGLGGRRSKKGGGR